METLSRLDPSDFFLFKSHAEKAVAIASVTGSVRLTGSPSTPATATPRMSLPQKIVSKGGFFLDRSPN